MLSLSAVPQLIGYAFILVGLFTGLIFLNKAIKALRTRNWPATAGTLEGTGWSKVSFEWKEPGGTDRASVGRLDFRYTYAVDGKTYQGRRVTASDFVNKTGGALNRLTERYKGQRNIVVYYNPRKPSESVLIPGASFYNFTPLITSALFIAAGWFVAFGGVFDR